MSKSPISSASAKRIIDAAWWALVRVTQSHLSHEVQDAFEAELRAERAHRRMGARFSSGSAQYRLGADYAAKLFVLRHVFEAPATVDLADVGRFRPAVVMCYSIAARMKKYVANARYIDASHPTDKTLWAMWLETHSEVKMHHSVKSCQVSGTVRSLSTGALQREFLTRCERHAVYEDKSVTLDSPLFMCVDYCQDVVV